MSRRCRMFVAAPVFLATALFAWCGCGRDATLADKTLRHATVRTVSHFGLTFDPGTDPETVAAAVLRAIREDFFAKSSTEREAALDVQFDLAAAGAIASRNRSTLSRDEYVHHVVTRWTPTVAHYANDFETDLTRGAARLVNGSTVGENGSDEDERALAMEVPDPGGDPNGGAVMVIWMARDNGFWRVLHFGFNPKRSLAGADGPAFGDDPAPH